MTTIESYVVFDIETTGLPCQERNQTKITELSFLATTRNDIERTGFGKTPLYSKLSLIFNPIKEINPEVVALTGLSNSLLQNASTFKHKIKTIIAFLEELPKPVCLVAHNGNIFDFKILLTEFKDVDASLPNDLLCVDSLVIFRNLLKGNTICYYTLKDNTTTPSSFNDEHLTDDDDLTDDDEWPKLNVSKEEWQQIDDISVILSDLSCGHPQDNNPKKKLKIETTEQHKENNLIIKTKSGRDSYNLQALYKRLLNKDVIQEHRAESDCLILLECITAMKQDFLQSANDCCKLLIEIQPFRRY